MKRRNFIKRLETATGGVEALQNLVDHVEPPFVEGHELRSIYEAIAEAKTKLMVALRFADGVLSLDAQQQEEE